MLGSMYPERDREIWNMRQTGKKLREIGDQYGLTVGRIRQILAREWRRDLMEQIRRKRREGGQ